MDNFTNKTREALQKPLCQRCEEIEKIIEDSSTQNLHGFFSQLLSDIFGYSGGSDWGLKTLSRQSKEFAILRKFLSPQGAVFKLIDKLQPDELHRYEFYISCLPLPTQTSLSEGFIPVLYHNKVPIRTSGESLVNVVLLDPFEYYMFHFAYYIVHQQRNRESNFNTLDDQLYLFVVEDYLQFFLPIDGLPLHPASHAKTSPAVTTLRKASPWQEQSPHGRSQYYKHQFKGLIKPSSGGLNLPSCAMHHGMFDHSSEETWRSEIFLQILVEFWLNQNTRESVTSNVLSHGKDYFMPSSDHVRVVRMLVKHVHSFVYAKGPDIHQQPILHPFDELRRNIIPHFLQKKLYHFFHHCFSHWPLDPSFRYVMETWLSFIQPWRYSKSPNSNSQVGGSDESRETACPQWKTFVFDNLLFYSGLFLEFTSRACRFNLCSAKDAHLLFRVVKVFAQPHLVDMVEDGESVLLAPSKDQWQASYRNMFPSSSALRAQILDLEGPSYMYQPVFCIAGVAKVNELQARLSAALSEATSRTRPAHQSLIDTNRFASWIKGVFGSNTFAEDEFDRKAEGGKLVTYLEQASTLLSKIVQTSDLFDGGLNKTIPWENNTSPMPGHRLSTSHNVQGSLPDHVETDAGLVPTPLGRYQMMNGLRKFEVRYTGDPELQPIRSFENATLVRLLYKLSSHLNDKCGKSLENIYTNSRVFRRIVCCTSPAVRSATFASQASGYSAPSSSQSPQRTVTPKISLRFFASYRTMMYLLLFWLLCQVVSMNRLLLVLVWICIFLVMVLYHFLPVTENAAVAKKKVL